METNVPFFCPEARKLLKGIVLGGVATLVLWLFGASTLYNLLLVISEAALIVGALTLWVGGGLSCALGGPTSVTEAIWEDLTWLNRPFHGALGFLLGLGAINALLS